MPITAEGVAHGRQSVPLWERETLTLPQAAAGCSTIDYDGLLVAVNQRDVDVFRPLNKRGEPGRRHVRKEEMRRYIKTLEE